MAEVLGITLQYDTTKHWQKIGMLERTHASLNEKIMFQTGGKKFMWHMYVNIANLNYNAAYHTSIGCDPSRLFHGRVPYIVLDLKMGIPPQRILIPNSQIAKVVLKKLKGISMISARTPCKPISNTRRIMIKKPSPRNSKNNKM